MHCLADKIYDIAQPVTLYGALPAPFEVVALDMFDFTGNSIHPQASLLRLAASSPVSNIEEDIDAETVEDIEGLYVDRSSLPAAYPVNGEPPCRFHLHCTLPPKDNSFFCSWHHLIVAQDFLQHGVTEAQINHPKHPPFQQQVTFTKPDQIEIMNSTRELHQVFAQYTAWTIDIEFAQPHSAHATPFMLAVRGYSSVSILPKRERLYDKTA